MRLQIDRFKGNDRVVVLSYPDGREGFDLPGEFFPAEVPAGDVFDVRVERDRGETGWRAEENRRSLGGLSGGGR